MKISQVMRSYPKKKEAYLEFVALSNVFRAGNQVGEDWKKVNCLGDKMLYSRRCVFCRTISLPSFKLAKIALFTYLM